MIAGEFNYGIHSGYLSNFYNSNIKDFGKPTCCPEWIDGTGNGLTFGISSAMQIMDYTFLGIEANILIENASLSSIEQETINVAGEDYLGKFEHLANLDFLYFGLSPFITYQLPNFLVLKGGLNLNYLINSEFEQSETIIFPVDRGVFKDTKTRQRNQFDGKIPNTNKINFGIFSSISYSFPMNKSNSLTLNPEFSVFYQFNDLVDNYNFKKYGFKIGLNIIFE